MTRDNFITEKCNAVLSVLAKLGIDIRTVDLVQAKDEPHRWDLTVRTFPVFTFSAAAASSTSSVVACHWVESGLRAIGLGVVADALVKQRSKN